MRYWKYNEPGWWPEADEMAEVPLPQLFDGLVTMVSFLGLTTIRGERTTYTHNGHVIHVHKNENGIPIGEFTFESQPRS